MEDNKIVSKLNRYKNKTFNSFGGTVIFAIFLGISFGIGNVYPSVFINELLTVFFVATGVSLGGFIFSSIKQLKYQELIDKTKKEDTDYNQDDTSKQTLESSKACQVSMSNTQHIDSIQQMDEPSNLSNNRVLQLIRKKVK
jgi:uncharacterized membrane protein